MTTVDFRYMECEINEDYRGFIVPRKYRDILGGSNFFFIDHFVHFLSKRSLRHSFHRKEFRRKKFIENKIIIDNDIF